MTLHYGGNGSSCDIMIQVQLQADGGTAPDASGDTGSAAAAKQRSAQIYPTVHIVHASQRNTMYCNYTSEYIIAIIYKNH